MAIDFKLDEYHDLDLSSGTIELVSGKDEIIQRLRVRLLSLHEEWIYNIDDTYPPWIGEMTDVSVPQSRKEQLLKRCILDTDGISSILEFEFTQAEGSRNAVVTFSASTIYGTVELELGV